MKISYAFFFQKALQIQSNKRSFSALTTGVAGILSKASSLLVQIITIPLLTSYLGKEQFGILLTFISVTLFLGVSDLGLGINLQNKLPVLEANQQNDEARDLISASFLIMSVFCVFIIIIFLGLYYFIDFFDFLKFRKDATNYTIVPIIVVCFSLTMPFLLINKAYAAKFKGYINEVFSSISFILILFLLWCAVNYKWEIIFIALIYQGIPLIMAIISFIYFFALYKELSINFKNVSKKFFANTFRESVKYLLIPFSIMLINAPDSFFIAKFIGVEEVVTYNIVLRFVYLFTFPVILLVNPYLYSYNDAFAKNDILWIKKMNKNIILTLSGICILFFTILFFFGIDIIRLWVGKATIISHELLLVAGMYIIFTIFNSFFSIIANTSPYLSLFIRILPFSAITSLIFKFILLQFYPTIESIFLGTMISMICIFFIPLSIRIKIQLYG
ncbi:oligosaccharide flippase family protein [Runella sp.]|uniref:oligosaccharide flippase family protein n=1 Tax=Runella sp. TaxID=1960881 RepID=UPI003D0ECE85